MKSNKFILLTMILSLSGCALQNSTSNKVESLSSSTALIESSITNKDSSSVISNTSTSSNVESNSSLSTSTNSSENTNTNISSSTLGESSNTDYSEKTLVIDCTNFNTLSYIKLDGVVVNEQYKDEEFTFNANGTMKSKEIKGIKEIKIHQYQVYNNLDVFANYNGTGSAATEKFETGNKEAIYTYTFNGINEFCIKNTAASNRTHVYSVTITYTGNAMSGSSNNSSSNTSSSSSSSSSNKPSSSTNTNTNTSTSTTESTHYTGTYYNNYNLTLTGSSLKQELRTLITKTHTYKSTYDDLKTSISKADASLTNPSKILLIYSRKEVNGKWDGAATWNREHVWPQSKGWFKTSGAGADLHHIRPEDPGVNNTRGSTPFGENSGYTPVDAAKGDVARIIFYLLTRYSESDSYSITSVASSFDMLLRWNALDPVDAWEMQRNKVGEQEQGNRNPFIDYPELANSIWG